MVVSHSTYTTYIPDGASRSVLACCVCHGSCPMSIITLSAWSALLALTVLRCAVSSQVDKTGSPRLSLKIDGIGASRRKRNVRPHADTVDCIRLLQTRIYRIYPSFRSHLVYPHSHILAMSKEYTYINHPVPKEHKFEYQYVSHVVHSSSAPIRTLVYGVQRIAARRGEHTSHITNHLPCFATIPTISNVCKLLTDILTDISSLRMKPAAGILESGT